MLPRRLLALAPLAGLTLAGLLTGVAPMQSASATDAALPLVSAVSSDSLADAYGVGVHLNWLDTPYANASAITAALTNLGVRHVRDDLYLNAPRQYAAIRAAAAQGIKFDLITGRPTDSTTAAQNVSTIATQLPGAVESIEGSNEWDISGRSNWAAEVRARQAALYVAAKTNPATAALPVLAPALAFAQNATALGSMAATSDDANGHFYAGGQIPGIRFDQDMPRLAAISSPNEPLIVTEAGYHNGMNSTASHKATPEDVTGDYMPRMLLDSYSRGVKRVYSYELLDHFNDPGLTNAEDHFGLLHYDMSPKPAYTAMKTVLGLTSDTGASFTPGRLAYSVTGGGSDLHQLLLQRHDGRFVLFLWRDVSEWNPTTQQRVAVTPQTVTLNLAQSAALGVVRPTAGATPVTTANASTLTLPLGAEAMAVTIDPTGTPSTTTPTTTTPTTPTTTAPPTTTPTAPTTPVTTAPPTTTPTTPSTPTTPATPTTPTAPTTPVAPVTPSTPVAPTAPTSVVATPGNGSVQLTWSQPASATPVRGYQVVQSPAPGSKLVAAGTHSLSVTGLRNGQRYSFTVRAIATSGVSTAVSSATVVPAAPPSRPGGVRAKAHRGGRLVVAWRRASDNGSAVTAYRVSNGSTTTEVSAARLQTVLSGLRRHSTLRIGVAAGNGVGWSDFSWSKGLRVR